VSIAIIGAAGQLGRDLCTRLGDEAVPLTHRDVDLIDRSSLRGVLTNLSPAPRTVVNCAAFNHVDDAETRPADAFAVNVFGVRELSLICRELNCVLVHFSTDHVFGIDCDRREPYDELAVPGPLSVYGLSKLAGEYFVRANCPRHFIVRTCGLYGLYGSGGKGRNFVETMARLAAERRPIRVVNDQTCTPTYTADLAEAVWQLLGTDAFGLYHWTNGGSCTWYEFACEIFRQAGLSAECSPITTEQYGARAARPSYSVLATAKFQQLGFAPPRHWTQALGAYLDARRSAQT
jgi:dTDP-4-dehydrorhamnose reductase